MSSLSVTTPWVRPGPQSLLACPVHLTSVWVVCYIDSSRNLMPSSQRICLVDFQREGGSGLPPCSTEPDSHIATFPGCCRGMPPPVSGFSSGEGQLVPAASQRDRDHEKRLPPPCSFYLPILVLSTQEPTAALASSKVC